MTTLSHVASPDLIHRLLPLALARVPDAVYCTDADGRIVFVNAAFCRLYGRDEPSVLGQDASAIAPSPARPEAAIGEAEVVHRAQDGRELAIGLSWIALHADDGQLIGSAHVARDLTEQRRREDALRRALEEVTAQQAALSELAVRDELTGLYNHQEMVRLLREEIERCRRYRRPLALLLVDVDDFRHVCGRYGELAGDEILRQIAGILRESLRPVDRPARYSGHELGIVLPDTYATDAVQVAERLRGLINDAVFQVVGENRQRVSVAVTVSLGVAGIHDVEESPDELLRAANAALLEAQRRGRNCTVAYVDLAIPRTP